MHFNVLRRTRSINVTAPWNSALCWRLWEQHRHLHHQRRAWRTGQTGQSLILVFILVALIPETCFCCLSHWFHYLPESETCLLPVNIWCIHYKQATKHNNPVNIVQFCLSNTLLLWRTIIVDSPITPEDRRNGHFSDYNLTSDIKEWVIYLLF